MRMLLLLLLAAPPWMGCDGLPSGTRALGLSLAEGRSCAIVPASAEAGVDAAILSIEGSLYCWGELGDAAPTPRATRIVGAGWDVVHVSAGQPSCAALATGAALCWGSNAAGELGDGSTDPSVDPVRVSGLSDAVQVGTSRFIESSAGTAARGFACALRAGGGVSCWGAGDRGQLGDGGSVDRSRPVSIAGLLGVSQIALGAAHACALLADGGLRCWGAGDRGQLGDGARRDASRPSAVSGAGFVEIVAGRAHTCARDELGQVYCWGAGDRGQLGVSPSTSDHATPSLVAGLGPVLRLAAGSEHTCAIDEAGLVWCWGANDTSQLGALGGDRATPGSLSRISGAVEIAAGLGHTCALVAGDLPVVRCWGSNGSGELGDGTLRSSQGPRSVLGLP